MGKTEIVVVNCPICGPIKGTPRPCVGLREGYVHTERLELERKVAEVMAGKRVSRRCRIS
jgi:hypothetical protein